MAVESGPADSLLQKHRVNKREEFLRKSAAPPLEACAGDKSIPRLTFWAAAAAGGGGGGVQLRAKLRGRGRVGSRVGDGEMKQIGEELGYLLSRFYMPLFAQRRTMICEMSPPQYIISSS